MESTEDETESLLDKNGQKKDITEEKKPLRNAYTEQLQREKRTLIWKLVALILLSFTTYLNAATILPLYVEE